MEHKDTLILYTNWKGETSWRLIRPIHLSWESNKYYYITQWLLSAWDHEKNGYRHFAVKDILYIARTTELTESQKQAVEELVKQARGMESVVSREKV